MKEFEIHFSAGQRLGDREHQEDEFGYLDFRETDHGEREHTLLVLADGMGGHVGGDRASSLAVRRFMEYYDQSDEPISEAGASGDEERDSKTERAAGMPDAPASDSGRPSSTYDKKTRKISRSSDARGGSSAPAASDDPKTRIMGRDKRDNEAASTPSDPMDDPVVGWT